jgi:hypothetical protein
LLACEWPALFAAFAPLRSLQEPKANLKLDWISPENPFEPVANAS